VPKTHTAKTKSFFPTVHLKPGEVCCLKNHFGGLLRELVGYYDRMAGNHKQRFVFTSQKTLATKCKRWSKGRPYTYDSVREGVEFLRDIGLLTAQVHMQDGRGRPREGVQVFRHDDVCSLVDNTCTFIGLGLPREPLFSEGKRRASALRVHGETRSGTRTEPAAEPAPNPQRNPHELGLRQASKAADSSRLQPQNPHQSGLSLLNPGTSITNEPTEPARGASAAAMPGWLVSSFYAYNQRGLKIGKDSRATILHALEEYGEDVVKLAWSHFVHQGEYDVTTKWPVYLFCNDLAVWIKKAKEELDAPRLRELADKRAGEEARERNDMLRRQRQKMKDEGFL